MDRDNSILIIEPDGAKARYLAVGIEQLLRKCNEESKDKPYFTEVHVLQTWTQKEYAANPLPLSLLPSTRPFFKSYDPRPAGKTYIESMKAGFDELTRDCQLLFEMGKIPVQERWMPGLLPRSILINLDNFDKRFLNGRTYETDYHLINLVETALFLNVAYGVRVLGLVNKSKERKKEYADFPIWCADYAAFIEEFEGRLTTLIPPDLVQTDQKQWNAEQQQRWAEMLDKNKTLEHRMKTDERVEMVFRK